MGIAQSALILLGIGIVSSRFQAGEGLGELGAGIQSLIAAPLTGTGTGLSSFAGGVRDLSETLGDLGRGLGELFENIPSLPPPREGPPRHGTGVLIPDGGGNASQLLPGGGGNAPSGASPPPAPIVVQPPPPFSRPSTRPILMTRTGGSTVMML